MNNVGFTKLTACLLTLLCALPLHAQEAPAYDADKAQAWGANEQGLLVYAGALDGKDGLRGLFIFATADLEAARKAVDTDPVIVNGEMVAELHKHCGSAALLAVNEWHPRLIKPKP